MPQLPTLSLQAALEVDVEYWMEKFPLIHQPCYFVVAMNEVQDVALKFVHLDCQGLR